VRSTAAPREDAAQSATAGGGARRRSFARRLLKILGPGFITGASDDDPSGIGTYAVAGASLGLASLWTALVTFPLMAAVQTICARLGLVSGMGLAGILRRRYPKVVVYPAVLLLVVANTINIGADLEGIADAVGTLVGQPVRWLVVPVALAILAVQVFASYRLLALVFKWLTLALFAYVIDALIVRPEPWPVLRATFLPTFALDRVYLTTLVAIFGTTISPYLFFWQACQEVEEKKAAGKRTPPELRGATLRELRDSTIDVTVGMAASNAVMYFIILATALTLHAHGQTRIATAAEAAEALRPLAGNFAGFVFAAGIVGTGLLAIPILSASAAYAVSEAFRWREGLNEKWWHARAFYGVIVAATLAGTLMDFTGVRAMDALFWTAVLNGAVAPPLLVLIMLSARDAEIMERRRIGPLLTALGWIATAAMFLALIGLAWTSMPG
jgi:NRAMP (natural resistance-associated macrophage protein)-like metal ion transporter